jgi:hypothetical protein
VSKRYQIYLSSTLDDLRKERQGVTDVLGKQGFSVKQSYSASEQDLIASCVDDVAQCSVYIGIIGLRYGYSPPGGGGPSITELEFNQAQKHKLACYVFVKDEKADTYKPADLDSYTHENDDGKLIESFRQRLQSGAQIRTGRFSTVEDLKLAVAGKTADFLKNIEGGQPLLQSQQRNTAELTHHVCLLMVRGTDDATSRKLEPLCTDNRFRIAQISSDFTQYVKNIDVETRTCRVACWVLSPASISLFKSSPQALETSIDIFRFRFGRTFALLIDGATRNDLQATWRFDQVIERPGNDTEMLERTYLAIRTRTSELYPDRRISIPVMVLALTENEILEMENDLNKVMSTFSSKNERVMREQQYKDMRKAIAAGNSNWPQGFYGKSREAWAPFGTAQPNAEGLLQLALDRLNDETQRNGRERLLLSGENVKLYPRRYDFKEYLDDRYGSRANLNRIRDLGCLVLVDEMALLHPALRERADQFLSGQRVAVMSANPCDPAVTSVKELLDDLSVLRIGTLRERFRVDYDPRCELAVNSVERMQRWLRLILPELVPALGQLEPRQDLHDQMFAEAAPAADTGT